MSTTDEYFSDTGAGSQDPTQTSPDTRVDTGVFNPVDTDDDQEPDALYGYFDGVGDVVIVDSDGDGKVDTVLIDTDQDGEPDLTAVPNGDTWHIIWADGEGDYTVADLQSSWPELASALGDPGGTGAAPTTDDPVIEDPTTPTFTDDGQLIGNPAEWSDNWFQQSFDGSCVPAAVAQIYGEYTGQYIDDKAFIDIVNKVGGWQIGPNGEMNGVAFDRIPAIFAEAGLDVISSFGNINDLETALADGQGILVGVNADEIWYGTDGDNQVNHAVVVTGIGPGYDENGDVILNADGTTAQYVFLGDTGTPDGNQAAVPMDVFLDAWGDGNNLMITCDQSVDEWQAANPDAVVDAKTTGQPETQTQKETQTQIGYDGTASIDNGDVIPAVDVTSADQADLTPLLTLPDPSSISALINHSWVLLPVALGAGALLRNVFKK